MATDATGAPTPLGIPKFNTSADAPSGLGGNAQMDSIDALLAARVVKPAGLVSGETPVWNGVSWDRSSVTKLGLAGIAGPVLLGVRIFTASGTYTPTAGTRAVYVETIGGGGGAGSSPATGVGQNSASGGGGGGAYAASLLASGFAGASYTIGAAGAAGVGGAGGNGGDTIFGSNVVVAKGGGGSAIGGGPLGGAGYSGAPGSGGIAATSTGDLKQSGQFGGVGFILALGANFGGIGGASAIGFAGGGEQSAGTAPGLPGGANSGGGGAGGLAIASAASQNGGAGGSGLIRIWEFA